MGAHAAVARLETQEPFQWRGARPLPTLAVLFMGTLLWFWPVPEGLDIKTWHLFAIFVTTIFGVIAKPLPMGSIALIALGVCVATQTLSLEAGLSSFSSPVV